MTREEAIKALERAEGYIGIHYVNGVEDPYINPCLLKAIDFAVAALREQENRRWIPVTERLPEDNRNVLGCLKIGEESRIYPAFYAHGVWWDCIFNTTTTNSTTHWMPLPEPQKEETV